MRKMTQASLLNCCAAHKYPQFEYGYWPGDRAASEAPQGQYLPQGQQGNCGEDK